MELFKVFIFFFPGLLFAINYPSLIEFSISENSSLGATEKIYELHLSEVNFNSQFQPIGKNLCNQGIQNFDFVKEYDRPKLALNDESFRIAHQDFFL